MENGKTREWKREGSKRKPDMSIGCAAEGRGGKDGKYEKYNKRL